MSGDGGSRQRIRVSRVRRWRGVLVYLAIAFGLSWTAQVVLALLASRADGSGVTQTLGGGIFVVALALMWPPAVGAYVARRWVEGTGFADAGLQRGPWRYVIFAWFLPAVLTLVALAISLPVYPYDATLPALRELMTKAGQSPPMPLEALVALQVVQALTVAVPINGVFAFGEEFGWRGYLLLRLMERLGPWPGLVAHGAIWGLWHAPIIALTGYDYPQHPHLGVLWFMVFCTLMGVIFGWLRLASRSVLPPTVAHASLNAIAGLPLILLPGVDVAVAGTLWSPVGWIVLLLGIAVLQVTGALSRALHESEAQSPSTLST
jgi:membrane protease YdiL (CAAX protease family)